MGVMLHRVQWGMVSKQLGHLPAAGSVQMFPCAHTCAMANRAVALYDSKRRACQKTGCVKSRAFRINAALIVPGGMGGE
jgi:hypothetical protein